MQFLSGGPQALTISGLAANTWTGMNVSAYIPSNATGVVLLYEVTGSAGNAAHVRMTGSTDTYTGANVPQNGQAQLITGVNSSGSFDLQVLNVATGTRAMSMWLLGYFGPEATFFTNANNIATTTSSYANYSLSSIVPASTPAAIVFFASNPGSRSGYRIGSAGGASTDDFSVNVGAGAVALCTGIVGLDSSSQLQARSSNSSALKCMGYISTGIVWNLNSISRTPGTSGSFQSLTTESQAVSYLYAILESSAYNVTVCNSTGQGVLPNTTFLESGAAQVASGSAPTANISNTGAGIYELAYFLPTGVPPPQNPSLLYGLQPLLAQ